MKALILGGSRFIGLSLARRLVSAGVSVAVFNRGRSPDPLADGVERLRGDRRVAEDLEAALKGRSFDVAYDFLCYDAADARLAVSALSDRVGRFIHISTCSVYWCTGDFPCPVGEEDFERLEDFGPRPASIEYDYGYGKRKAEKVLVEAFAQRGFPVVRVRLPIVAGEEDPSLRYGSYCLRIGDGGPLLLPDGGHRLFRHVYVDDAVRGLEALASLPGAEGEAYNLACEEILSLRTIVLRLAGLMGRTPRLVSVPTPDLLARGIPLEFSPFSQQASQVPSIRKAVEHLGWETTPFPVWLERAARWAIDAMKRPGTLPEVWKWRERELNLIRQTERKIKSGGARDGTSGAPPG